MTEKLDPIFDFISSELVLGEGYTIKSSEMYLAYKNRRVVLGDHSAPLGQRTLSRRVYKHLKNSIKVGTHRRGGEIFRGCSGVGLRNGIPTEELRRDGRVFACEYAVFVWKENNPRGGWADISGKYERVNQARNHPLPAGYEGHIIDLRDGSFVAVGKNVTWFPLTS